jgi:hypothetical protein
VNLQCYCYQRGLLTLIPFSSLLISVKADTAALRRDVQQLLAKRRRQRRPSIESSCETVITMAAEKLIEADPSASKKPPVGSDNENATSSTDYDNDSDDNNSMTAEPDSSINRGPAKEIPKKKPDEMICSRLRRLEWYTGLHKTQCVTICPEGDIVAISSMKEIAAWDLREHDDDMMRPPLQFDNGLVSWHVPTKLAIDRDEFAGLILAASSNRVSSGLGGKSAESKLLVHSYETDKTLYTHTKSRRSVALTLAFNEDEGPTIEVLSPSLRRTYSTCLVRHAGGGMKGKENETKFDTEDLDLDDIPTGLSVSGECFLAVTKRSNKHSAPVAFSINTVTGKPAGKITLPDGCTPVTGIPIHSRGCKAVFILWHEDTKETEIFRWYVNMGRHVSVRAQRFTYAGAAWQRYSVSPDGRFVAVCVSHREVEIVDAKSAERVALLRLKDSLPPDMGTSKAGLELTRGNCRGKLMAWSMVKRRLVVATKKGAEVWDINGGN